MQERAEGLIVRVRPLTETSLIVHWLTREWGRLGTVARGARRPRSPFQGRLDLFFHEELVFYRSRRSDLHLLREVHLLASHPGLQTDPERLRLAAEAVHRIEQVTEPEAPVPGVFELLLGLVRHLNGHAARARLRLAFELRLLSLLGWDPVRPAAALSEPARVLVERLRTEDWAALEVLDPAGPVTREVNRFVERVWRDHVGVTVTERTCGPDRGGGAAQRGGGPCTPREGRV
jgi:DNA repair protein RecO (recombination protein O)